MKLNHTANAKAKTTAKTQPKAVGSTRKITPEQSALVKAEIDRYARQDAADAVWDRVAIRNGWTK